MSVYLQEDQLGKKIAAVCVQLENSRQFALSVQGTYIRIYDHLTYEVCEV